MRTSGACSSQRPTVSAAQRQVAEVVEHEEERGSATRERVTYLLAAIAGPCVGVPGGWAGQHAALSVAPTPASTASCERASLRSQNHTPPAAAYAEPFASIDYLGGEDAREPGLAGALPGRRGARLSAISPSGKSLYFVDDATNFLDLLHDVGTRETGLPVRPICGDTEPVARLAPPESNVSKGTNMAVICHRVK